VLLKQCATQLAPSICCLINISLAAGSPPTEWLKANVVPIHKGGARDTVCNYRPVSLLSVVSKVAERCIFNRIFPHVEHQLHNSQHGFLPGKSTATQLLEFTHNIGNVTDSGGQVDVIYLDFAKAFDSVPHRLLIHKLKSYGFHGNLLRWLEGYLFHRKQRTVSGGTESDWLPVLSGVPQGSILGPLLFSLYINDMPTSILDSLILLYADDTKCYRTVHTLMDCYLLQRDLNLLLEWSTVWKLHFNPRKCKALSITNSRSYYLRLPATKHFNR
jgi:hypothetical protein